MSNIHRPTIPHCINNDLKVAIDRDVTKYADYVIIILFSLKPIAHDQSLLRAR